jgi:hypothetical protein
MGFATGRGITYIEHTENIPVKTMRKNVIFPSISNTIVLIINAKIMDNAEIQQVFMLKYAFPRKSVKNRQPCLCPP